MNIPVEMIHYGVTKTMQVALARGLAETTVGTGVTVNSVLPGPTRSEGVEQFVKDLARSQGKTVEEMEREFFQTARPTSLLRRFETTDEIAAMVAFIASPMSSATNGAAHPRRRRPAPLDPVSVADRRAVLACGART